MKLIYALVGVLFLFNPLAYAKEMSGLKKDTLSDKANKELQRPLDQLSQNSPLVLSPGVVQTKDLLLEEKSHRKTRLSLGRLYFKSSGVSQELDRVDLQISTPSQENFQIGLGGFLAYNKKTDSEALVSSGEHILVENLSILYSLYGSLSYKLSTKFIAHLKLGLGGQNLSKTSRVNALNKSKQFFGFHSEAGLSHHITPRLFVELGFGHALPISSENQGLFKDSYGFVSCGGVIF